MRAWGKSIGVERATWLAACMALAIAIALLDALAGNVILVGLLAVPPLVAVLRLGPFEVAAVALVCIGLALALGPVNGVLLELDSVVRATVVVASGALSVGIAWLRGQMRAADAWKLAVVDAALECIVSMDREGRIIEFNRAAEATFGLDRDEAVGRELAEVLVPEELRSRHREGLTRYLESGESTILGRRIEMTALHASGREFPVELSVIAVEGAEGELFIGFMRDITDRMQTEASLAHRALHDPLTGLPNRTLLLDRVALAARRAERDEANPALLFLDLDDFKSVNDSLGHVVGDRVLVAMGERFRKAIRPGDTVARLGGDEFTVLCEDVESLDTAVAIAERLVRAAAEPLFVDGARLDLGVSIGVVMARGEAPETLLAQADGAMYQAKQRGRGSIAVQGEPGHPGALSRRR